VTLFWDYPCRNYSTASNLTTGGDLTNGEIEASSPLLSGMEWRKPQRESDPDFWSFDG
jgi:hypothetical protein